MAARGYLVNHILSFQFGYFFGFFERRNTLTGLDYPVLDKMMRIVLILFTPFLLDFAGEKLGRQKNQSKSRTYCRLRLFSLDRLVCETGYMRLIKVKARRYRNRLLFAGINLLLSIAIPRGVVFIGYGDRYEQNRNCTRGHFFFRAGSAILWIFVRRDILLNFNCKKQS